MGTAYTSSSIESKRKPKSSWKLYFIPSKTQERKSGDQKCYLWEKIVGDASQKLWMNQITFSQPACKFHHRENKESLNISHKTFIITSIIIWYIYKRKSFDVSSDIYWEKKIIFRRYHWLSVCNDWHPEVDTLHKLILSSDKTYWKLIHVKYRLCPISEIISGSSILEKIQGIWELPLVTTPTE